MSLFIIPFVNWGGVFEGYKVLFFWFCSFFLILYWIFYKRDFLLKVFDKWDMFYWLWILILTISSLFGVHPFQSIIGGSYRHQGVIFFICLWLVGKSVKLLDSKQKKLLPKAIAASAFIQSIIVIVQVLLNKGIYFERPLGTFGEPNAIAGYLSFSSFFYLNIYTLALSAIAIILTYSRTGIVTFLIVLVGIVNLQKKLKLIVVLLLLPTLLFVWTKRSIPNTENLIENRKIIAKLTIEKIMQKPILGYGAESGEVVFDKAYLEKEINLGNFMVDRSHNLFLDIAMWSGISGLSLFSLFLFGNVFLNIKLKNLQKLFALSGFIFFSFLQPLGVVHWIIFFLIINW